MYHIFFLIASSIETIGQTVCQLTQTENKGRANVTSEAKDYYNVCPNSYIFFVIRVTQKVVNVIASITAVKIFTAKFIKFHLTANQLIQLKP